MKRMIAILVVLAAASGAAFAQEFKFDGYVNSGVGVLSSDVKDSDTTAKAFGVDSESNGYRIRLNGTYTNADKNIGVKFRLQSQRVQGTQASAASQTVWDWEWATGSDPANRTIGNTADGKWVQKTVTTTPAAKDTSVLSIPYFYGWAKFFNDIFTLNAGIVDNGTWTTADWWINEDAGEGVGALLQASPIKGLDLGLGAYLLSQQSGASNNVLIVPNNSNSFANIIPKIGDVKYVYSGAYTLPDVVRVGASFRWKNKAGGNGTQVSSGKYVYDGREESSALFGDIRVLAVKDLTAVVAFNFDKIEDFDNAGNIIFSETFGYKLNDLGIGLNAVQFLYNRTDAAGDKVDYDPGLLFNFWGSYTLGKIVPRLDLVYFAGGQSAMAGAAQTYHRRGYANTAHIKDSDTTNNYSVFTIRPSVKFNLDGKTFVEIGDAINIDSTSLEGGYKKDPADANDTGKTRITNVFYLDFKWSF